MKKYVIPIVLFLLPFVVIYLSASFINLSFDVTTWSETARAICIALSLFFGGAFGGAFVGALLEANK